MIQVQDCHEEKTLSDKFTKAQLIEEIFRLRQCQENQAKQIHAEQHLIDSLKRDRDGLVSAKIEEIKILQVRCNEYFEKAVEAKNYSDRLENALDEYTKRLKEVTDDKNWLKQLISKSNIDERRYSAI